MRNRGIAKPIWLSIAAGVLISAVILSVLWRLSSLSRHTSIREFQNLPLHARLRVAGVVTYIDPAEHRFWIQDDTGALPVPEPAPAGIRLGDTVSVTATKGGLYNPLHGPISLDLQNVAVAFSAARIKLPPPTPVELAEFPSAEKNGVLIQISGVARKIADDHKGHTIIRIATTGPEVPLVLPRYGADPAKIRDAEVHVIGVPEQIPNPTGGPAYNSVWVASLRNFYVEPAPREAQLYSVRTLYLDPEAKAGHLVRLRGQVLEAQSGSITLADPWGTLDCDLTDASLLKVGSTVEVEGFPQWDGLRISLTRATTRPFLPQQSGAPFQQKPDVPALTTVEAIRGLTPARASLGLPVRLHGVLTYVDPYYRQFYIQDATGGIYLKYSGNQQMTAGMRVTLTGITNAGNFAPVVLAPRVSIEGKSALPSPIVASTDQASAGILDSQFVSLEGIVHPIRIDKQRYHPVWTFELISSLGRVHVFTSPEFPNLQEARKFEDARVRMSGVLGSVFNSRRQLVGYQLLVQRPEQIQVLEPGVANPFAMETTPIQDLLRFSLHVRYGHRVKVAGTVTLVTPEFFYLQDNTSGVEIRNSDPALHVGDQVEAVGYPTLIGRYSPVLTDASFRISQKAKTLVPKFTTSESIVDGHEDSMLVGLEGRLLMVLDEPSRITLVMQSGVRTFTAHLNTVDHGAELTQLRPGSILRISGVCAAQVDTDKLYDLLEHDPTEFQILLRSPKDVTVVRAASRWNLQFILILLAAFALLMPGALVWVTRLRRRVHLQNAELAKAAETAQAIRDLSLSMQSVSNEKRFDSKVSVRGSEDVVQLVIGFNRMLAELHQREREKQAAESKLKYMAMVDELTSLPNRRMLFDRLSHNLATAERHGRKLALLYIDLDGFKLVNDNLGHNIGDMLLTEVSQRLRARSRQADTLARIGGDEFTLVLDEIEGIADADAAARGLLDALSTPFLIDGHTIRIGASIGISIYPDHGNDAGQLLQQADCAMYAAKHNGKNRIVHFGDELGNAARERMTLENELRRAVADGGISLQYQPEFDLATNCIVRFEALARWNHPTLGMIPPLLFIPIAEENGLIFQLGTMLLERACRDAVQWNRVANSDIQVAVNVSSVQLGSDRFVEHVEEILQRAGLRPELLQIELTESVTVSGIERISAMIERLKNMGVSVVLDDFGTGYSCLSYLPRLPFDALKIDRSFVNELRLRPESIGFVQSIVTMAHNLKMRVIMEGIETEDELEQILVVGADEVQGYLFGTPTPDPLTYLNVGRRNLERGTAPATLEATS